MLFNSLSTWNWSRTVHIWVDGIQVCFQPVVALERRIIKGGFLRKVRGMTPLASGLVSLLFAIHCTGPQGLPRKPESKAAVSVAFPATGIKSISPYQFSETGLASWYGKVEEDSKAGEDGEGSLNGFLTASGEVFDSEQLTCAHRTLPFGALVEVSNLNTRKKTVLRVNDRGPYLKGRVLDVSRKAALDLGFLGRGVARVRVKAFYSDGRPYLVHPQAPQQDPLTVQVGQYCDPANAQNLSAALEECYGKAAFYRARLEGGIPVMRVCVGSFACFEDAQRAAEEIAKRFKYRGVEPYVTRRR